MQEYYWHKFPTMRSSQDEDQIKILDKKKYKKFHSLLSHIVSEEKKSFKCEYK